MALQSPAPERGNLGGPSPGVTTAPPAGGPPGNVLAPRRRRASRRLAVATTPGSSTTGFGRVEGDLTNAIAADQVVFQANATAGENAFRGLEAGIIVAAMLMALGCAWGLSIRLAEYR